MTLSPAKAKILRHAAMLPLLCGLALLLVHFSLEDNGGVDLLQYWSAAHVLLDGANPYAAANLAPLQYAAWHGGEAPLPILMWNPPQIFSFILPLGVLQFQTAAYAWMAVLLVLIWLSCMLILEIFPPAAPLPRTLTYAALASLCTFVPFHVCLYLEQISALLLFGFCLYLYCSRRSGTGISGTYLGGFFLAITLLKPHLLFLVYLLILVSSLKTGSWRTLCGMICGFACLSVVPLLADYRVFAEYFAAAGLPPIYWKTPTVGSWLQGMLNCHVVWIRMLPTLICTVLAIPVFFRLKNSACSIEYLVALVPISLVTAPYGWLFDQILILPWAMYVFAEAVRLPAERKKGARLCVLAMLLINLACGLIPRSYGQEYYLWYPLAFWFLGIYLRSKRKSYEAVFAGSKP